MDDQNFVMIEGVVTYMDSDKEVDGKHVLNFTIENSRRGGTQRFRYNCVVWNKNIPRFEDKIQLGAFIRITGHLQDSVKRLEDGTEFRYCKICCDWIDN